MNSNAVTDLKRQSFTTRTERFTTMQ